jgi:hypothetical protein
MADYPLLKATYDVEACIEYALEKKMHMPATILLYSAIDAAAWLSCKHDKHTNKEYIEWVDKWMLPLNKLQCTAIDLYAARCGILHTFTSKTDLTQSGRTRQMCYVYGDSTVDEMEYILRAGKNKVSDYAVVHFNDLFDSYKTGYRDFVNDAQSDPAKLATYEKKIGAYYRQIDDKEADKMVEAAKRH